MALKSTVYKAALQLSDIDRGLYADHALTLALHPSETEERLMIRLLAYALECTADDLHGTLQNTKGLSDADEPALWHLDLTGQLVHWVEIGQPDARRLARACGRAPQVSVYAYSSAVPVWWAGLERDVARLANLRVWQVDADESRALAALAQRSMQLTVTVQDGLVWVNDGQHQAEVHPRRLFGPEGRGATA